MINDDLLTRAEAASYMKIPEGWLRRHIFDGPPRIKIGRQILYDAKDLDIWLETMKERGLQCGSLNEGNSIMSGSGQSRRVTGSLSQQEKQIARELRSKPIESQQTSKAKTQNQERKAS